jgi:hypothetical protein
MKKLNILSTFFIYLFLINSFAFAESKKPASVPEESSSQTEQESGSYISDRFKKDASVVNVRDFGARGDNSADDTASIQKAIDFIKQRGGVLYFPKGDYKITDSLDFNLPPSAYKQILVTGDGKFNTRILAYVADKPVVELMGSGDGKYIFEHITIGGRPTAVPSVAFLIGRRSGTVQNPGDANDQSNRIILRHLDIYGDFKYGAIYNVSSEVNEFYDIYFQLTPIATQRFTVAILRDDYFKISPRWASGYSSVKSMTNAYIHHCSFAGRGMYYKGHAHIVIENAYNVTVRDCYFAYLRGITDMEEWSLSKTYALHDKSRMLVGKEWRVFKSLKNNNRGKSPVSEHGFWTDISNDMSELDLSDVVHTIEGFGAVFDNIWVEKGYYGYDIKMTGSKKQNCDLYIANWVTFGHERYFLFSEPGIKLARPYVIGSPVGTTITLNGGANRGNFLNLGSRSFNAGTELYGCRIELPPSASYTASGNVQANEIIRPPYVLIESYLRARAKSDIVTDQDYQIDENDNIILADATTQNIVIRLPACEKDIQGFIFTVKKIDSFFHAITVKASGVDLLDGAKEYYLDSPFKFITLLCAEDNRWFIIGKN